jgi:hypothetical protein
LEVCLAQGLFYNFRLPLVVKIPKSVLARPEQMPSSSCVIARREKRQPPNIMVKKIAKIHVAENGPAKNEPVDMRAVWNYINERWALIDRRLVDIGWQPDRSDERSNRVMVHILLTESVSDCLENVLTTADACLFVALSYTGEEIAYPHRLFNSKAPDFWSECFRVSSLCSRKLMMANMDKCYYAERLAEYMLASETITDSSGSDG